MVNVRKIKKVWQSKPTVEGAGVHLKRAFGFHEVPDLDPFLLFDDFHAANPALYLPGFPWHPHRGIETITYVLNGDVEHGDSMGNQGTISAGDIQWMTAGSGIIHQEMPKGDGSGLMWGFQLWANLPSSHKMMPPRYREVKRAQIPEVTLENGAQVKIICGEVAGIQGPVRDIIIDPGYLDVFLPAHSTFVHPVKRSHTVFAYVVEGAGFFDVERDSFAHEADGRNTFDFNRQCLGEAETLITFGDGDAIAISTEERPLRFLLVWGKPIGEPVAWYGPIVMNTQEQLRTAFEEYRNGTFIKLRA